MPEENDMPFMNKTLSKEIMKRTSQYVFRRKNLSKQKTISSQRNCCVLLLKKKKKDYYNTKGKAKLLQDKAFWKTVKLFLPEKLPEYKPHNDSLLENVSDPILTVILKYRNHQSLLIIGAVCKNKSNKQPLFSQATRDEILKEILSLDTTKACQDTDIPKKILKENVDISSDFLFPCYNAKMCCEKFKISIHFNTSRYNTCL